MKEEKSRSKGIRDAGRRWGCDFKQDLPEVTFKQRFTSVREGALGEKTFQGEQSQHQGPGQIFLVLQSKARRPQGLESSD